MKNLFLIDGAAGTGKTDMLDYIQDKYSGRNQIAVLPKYTTREHRSEEKNRKLSLDLKFISYRGFQELQNEPDFYSYKYGGHSYGFHKNEIDKLLATFQNLFIIVRDRKTIQDLIQDYPKFCTIPVFIYTDREQCEKRLIKDSYSEEDVKFRLSRQSLAWEDYLKHSDLYREVIINNSNRNDFHRLIDSLLKKYSPENEENNMLVISDCERFTLTKPLVGFKKDIINRLYNYDRNVFLMMKFRDNNRLVYNFIKTQLEEVGFNCVRADEPEWNITNNVYNPLAVLYCCKYGIALFDEPEVNNAFSPNVAYELSIMHLQGKNCLILRHDSLDSVPFDLIKDLHQSYSRDLQLRSIVQKWVFEIKQGSDFL